MAGKKRSSKRGKKRATTSENPDEERARKTRRPSLEDLQTVKIKWKWEVIRVQIQKTSKIGVMFDRFASQVGIEGDALDDIEFVLDGRVLKRTDTCQEVGFTITSFVDAWVKVNRQAAEQKKEEGNQLYKTRNYREALQKYNEAIQLCPRTAAFYGNRSACHMMLSQFTQALADAKKAVQLDIHFVKGYIRVAKCCISLGNVMSAEQALERVVELDKASGPGLVQAEQQALAQLKKFQADTEQAYQAKDYEKALLCIDRSLSVAFASRALKVSRAEVLAYLGRYGEAQEIANDLLRMDNMNADAIYIRGLCLCYEDSVEKAFTHFQRVLRLDPDHQKAKDIYKKARVLKQKKEEGNEAFKSGKLSEAHKLYSEALEIDPYNKFTNAQLYFNRATVAAKLKRLEDSIKDCTSAIELDKKYLKALLRRAKSHLDLEHYEDAVHDYEAANRMDCGNAEVRQLLHEAKVQQSLHQAKVRLQQSKRKDYYKILGVGRGANADEIRKAYKERARRTHPDKHAGASESKKRETENKFKEVGEAYEVLSDTNKKWRYDNTWNK